MASVSSVTTPKASSGQAQQGQTGRGQTAFDPAKGAENARKQERTAIEGQRKQLTTASTTSNGSVNKASPPEAFFAPVTNNPHFERLKDAGLLEKNATVADFYNLKYGLEGKSFGEVAAIAGKHGLSVGDLTTSLVGGSQALGDRAFDVFKSFLTDPGFVGNKFASHEAGLRQTMINAGLKAEHTEKLFKEMLDIGGYTDDPVNGFANEYEYKKAVAAWTQGLGVIGNGGGSVVGSKAGQELTGVALEAARRAALTRFGTLPQGVTREQFLNIQQIAGKAAQDIGGIAYVHGSRATANARPLSDIDVKLVVDQKTFDSLWTKAFGKKNSGSAAWRTGQEALERGRIHAGEAKLRPIKMALQEASGKKVDISIVLKGGAFDTTPQIRIKP